MHATRVAEKTTRSFLRRFWWGGRSDWEERGRDWWIIWEEPDGKRGVRSEGAGVDARCFPLSMDVCCSGRGSSESIEVEWRCECSGICLPSGSTQGKTGTSSERMVIKIPPAGTEGDVSVVARPRGSESSRGWTHHVHKWLLKIIFHHRKRCESSKSTNTRMASPSRIS